MSYHQQIRIASGLNILAGFWLIVSPYGFGFYMVNPPYWSSVAVGFAVVIFATLRLAVPFRFPEISWINFALGLYLIASPFLFGFAGISSVLWNSVSAGLAIMVLAAWSAVAGSRGARLPI
jgi:hypothetical protein